MAIGGKGRGIQIVVGAEYTDKDLKRAQRDLDKLRKNTQANIGPMGKLGTTLRRSLGPAMAAAAAAAGALAIKLGVDGVKAAIEDEKTVATLANTLKQLGMAHEQANVEQFISDLEFATGVADEGLRPALGLLVASTGDLEEAQRRLGQAMDLAAFTGQDLDAIVRALTRSISTQSSGTLSRYGINLDQAKIKTEGFGAALDDALAPSVGAMDAQVNTLGGQFQRLQTQTDNLLEAFGYGFIRGFDNATGQVDDAADSLRDLQPIMEDLGESISDLVNGLADLSPVLLPILDGLLDVTGPLWDNISAAVAIFKDGKDPIEAFADAYGYATDQVTDFNNAVSGNSFGGGEWSNRAGDFADGIKGIGDEAYDAEEAMSALVAAMEGYAGLLDERAAARRYEKAVDSFRKSIKENGEAFKDTTAAGLENLDALDQIFDAAMNVAKGQEEAADKAETMRRAMDDAQEVMELLGLSEAKRRRLLQPFVDAQVELDKTYLSARDVRQALVDIPKDIDINVTIKLNEVWGNRLTGGDGYDWRGQSNQTKALTNVDSNFKMDTGPQFGSRSMSLEAPVFTSSMVTNVPGPSRPAESSGGLVINGGINVVSALGEKAEESVPRALRKLAFVAGI
jgi:hypothetical protein